MNNLIEAYIKDLSETPEASKINNLWERGYVTYSEAIKMLLEAAENNKYDFIIQYQKDKGGKYRDYCDTLYTYKEATEEVFRLTEAAPAFNWRYKKILKDAH